MYNKLILAALASMALMGIYFFFSPADIVADPQKQVKVEHLSEPEKPAVVVPKLLYGINVDSLTVSEMVIKKNQTLADLLLPSNVSYDVIHKVAAKSKDVFDIRKFRTGHKYTLLSSKDSLRTAAYLIYKRNPVDYVVYQLTDSIAVWKGQKEVTVQEKSITGVINSSLYQTMVDNGATPLLANTLSDVYAWQIDFFHIQKGDKFKVVFEEKYADGEFVGVGKVKAGYFHHAGEDYYAFLYNSGGVEEYFDEKGNSLRKAFLKAPLKYSRISSRFNRRRFHPVLKRVKAHLGTDYAAPKGTPIYAVGDGVVIAKGYTRGNGNYVKIRHNATYTTQYLHMSKFAKGIKQGMAVKQGEEIGYVGSTGLATGPHLCFRFWKNGKQEDWLREKMPASAPIADSLRNEYQVWMQDIKMNLDNMPIEVEEEVVMK